MIPSLAKKIVAATAVTTISLFSSLIASAANVNYSAVTSLSVGGFTLSVSSGSTATSVVVGSSSITVSTVEGESFTVTSGSVLATNPVAHTACLSGTQTVIVSGANTITITPSSGACLNTPVSGGSSSVSSPAQIIAPVVIAPTAVTADTKVGTGATPTTIYDVPDTGKASANAAVASSTDAKLRLDIVKDTKFKTDVKKQKAVNYTDIVKAPAVVENKDVVLDKKDPAAKATLLLAAKAETTAKQVKLSKFAMLSMPITEAQKQLGIKKLKAYYIDQNTGKAKALSGSKINKDKNLFIAKLKQLGGVVILTQKK